MSAFTDPTELAPLFSETLARVRARLDADANAGLSEDDVRFIDTREGSFYWDVTQGPAMEIARLWDAMSEMVAATFVSTAWGEYLDEHGRTFGLVRIGAQPAVGTLTFVCREATAIDAGTQAASVASQTGEVVHFQTTENGVSNEPLAVPAGVTVVALESGGVLSAGTRYYHVTACNEYGETTGSEDASAETTGSSGRNVLSWDPVQGAAHYQVYVTSEQASRGQLIGSTVATTFVDNGVVVPQGEEPTLNLTSGITLAAAAVEAGEIGNIAAQSITSLDTAMPTVYSVTNRERFLGGSAEESDDDFRLRIIAEYTGTVGGGNVSDYVRWVVGRGIERSSVVATWAGPGTVLVLAMMRDGSPVPPHVIANLQTFLDPEPGTGQGQAPIGAHVTVSTSTVVNIDIVATVTFQPGYSLDGIADTIATREAILTALRAYLRTLDPGQEVVYEHVQACFFVPGVLDIADVTVNGSNAARLPLAGGLTPEVAWLGTVTLSEATTPSPFA